MNKIFNQNFKDNFNEINQNIDYNQYLNKKEGKRIKPIVISFCALTACLVISLPLIFKNNNSSAINALKDVKRVYNKDNLPLNENYINSIKQFTINFNDTLNKDENIIYSPLSIQTCYTLLLEGANNNSYDELKKALCYNDSFSYSKEILRMLNNTTKDNDKTTLELNQSIWLDNKFKNAVHQDYLETLANNYYAEIFTGALNSEEAHNELASYINKKTRNFLNVKAEDFKDYNGICWLLNTIYLKGTWTNAFKKEQNYVDDFTNNDNSISKVTYMQNKSIKTGAYINDDYTIIMLPLYNNLKANLLIANSDLSIYKEKETLNSLLNFNKSESKIVSANVTLPQFKIQETYDLKNTFKALNVYDIFDENNADFTNMANLTDSNIYVANSKHEAGIEFTNEGIEGAAYTIIDMTTESAPSLEYITINFNKPFMFSISDMDNLPLFVGTVNNL